MTYSRGRYNFIPTDDLSVQRLIATLTVSAMRGCGIVTGWSARTATGIGSDGAPSAADTKQGAHTLQSYITSY